jgi:CHAT domain-containing protein/Tfp pilus assembly protein PilF
MNGEADSHRNYGRSILKSHIWLSPRKLSIAFLSLALLIGNARIATFAADQPATQIPIPAAPEIPQTPETIDRVHQLEADARKYMERHEADKALSKTQEAYGMSLEMKYADGQGRALTLMCEIYLMRGQATKAKELGENAIEMLSESGDKKSLGKARVALAQAYFMMDNPVWAANQLDQALKSFTQFGMNDAPEAAKVMTISGMVLVKMMKIKEAIRFYQGACSYYEQAGNVEESVKTRVALSGMMRELGWLVAAQEEANKALELARETKDKALVPAALAALAITQYNLGEYSNARKSYEELLYLKSANELAIARLQAGYAHTLAGSGDLLPAKAVMEIALKSLKAKGTPIEQAQVLNTFGCIEALDGHYPRAVQLITQALEAVSMVQPKQDYFAMVMLQNLAAAESRNNDNRNAKAHLLACFPYLKKKKDLLMEGRVYAALGEVCLNLQDPPEADKYLRAGITVSEKINDDTALWRDYTNLATLQLALGQQPQAKESLNSALSYFRSPQAGWFASPERLGFPTPREDLGQQLVSLLVSQDQYEPALIAAEQLKEESFINDWLRHGGEVKPYDRDIFNDLVNQRAHLHAAETNTSPDKLLKDWQNWLVRFKQLASTNRALARLIAPVSITYQDIAKGIQSNHAVAIDYLVGPHSTIVFTIDQSGRLNATKLAVGRAELQPQVSSLLASAKPDAQVERRTLQQLYQELLPEAVREVLPDNPDQTVVVLPDGVLYNLPFGALVDRSGKYLIEHHTLTLSSSMGVFLDSPPPYSHDMSVVMAPDAASPSANGNNYETNQIASLFQPDLVTNLVGKEAEINNLQEQAKGRTVLHFSSKVALSELNPQQAILPNLSNKDDEKNKVTADRLFGLNLPSDLVVWSGTTVNSKDLQGTAIKVFSRGLSYAGVRNVMMSLWVEPDLQRTNQLVDFYRGKEKGLNEAQSLRKAQLISISKNPSPRTWAAFQLLGPGY